MASLLAVIAAFGALRAWISSEETPSRDIAADPRAPLAADDAEAQEGGPLSDRVVHYAMEAELDPKEHRVTGKSTITWKNPAQTAVNELWIHLYLNAFRDDRTVFWRTPIGGFRGNWLRDPGRIEVDRFYVREMAQDLWPNASPTTPGDPEDATDIRVPLPKPVAPGETITIDVTFRSVLPSVTLRTGHLDRFHMVAQWFPKLAVLERDGTWAHFPFHRLSEFYADFGTYDVTIVTPSDYLVGAVGKSIEETAIPAEGGGSGGGEARVRRRFVAEDVHDFSFAAWDEFHEQNAITEDGIQIRCLFPPGEEATADLEIDAVRYGLGFFGRAFGPYPYKILTIVHPPDGAEEAGGMEYPTLITTGSTGQFDRFGVHATEILTIHELAHQWFYGLVASNEHRSPFLDEGLTSYAEVEAMEARYPDASAGVLGGLSTSLDATHRFAAMGASGHLAVSSATYEFISGGDYGALVYSRTAAVLRTLSRVYGEEATRRAIGHYARTHRFRHPTPEDLFAAIEEKLGEEAATAARIALTTPATTDYLVEEITSRRESSEDGSPPQWKGSALVRRIGPIQLPVDVLFVGEDGSRKTERWDASAAAARIPYTGTSKLAAVVVDPEHRILLDGDLANNAARADRGSAFSWRTFDVASFVFGVAGAGVLP